MSETRLPSGDPLSTRTRPEEGTWEIRVVDDDLGITLFDDDAVLLEDSDLSRSSADPETPSPRPG